MLGAGVSAGALCATLLLVGCGSSKPTGSGSVTVPGSTEPHSKSAKGSCNRTPEPPPHEGKTVIKPRLGLDPHATYTVTLWTNCGTIEIALDVAQAPKTTASFAYLVSAGFYNGLTFDNIAAHQDIQGGDPDEDGLGRPGYVVVEPPPPDTHYTRGTVAMARNVSGPPGASGSQFFIVTGRHANLPPQYPLVGQVVGSYAAINAIARLPTEPSGDGKPVQAVVIRHATIAVG